jgi:hypothetical protein
MLPLVNTGVALGVVFDMVTKPSSVPVSLGVIALGLAPAVLGRPKRSAPAGRGRGGIAVVPSDE